MSILVYYFSGLVACAGVGEISGLAYGVFTYKKNTEYITNRWNILRDAGPIEYAIGQAYAEGCRKTGRYVGAGAGLVIAFASGF
jgi:hypothetical protein